MGVPSWGGRRALGAQPQTGTGAPRYKGAPVFYESGTVSGKIRKERYKMQKSRDVFTNQTTAKGNTMTQGTTSHPAGNWQKQGYDSQELYSPRWRGPFEGYR